MTTGIWPRGLAAALIAVFSCAIAWAQESEDPKLTTPPRPRATVRDELTISFSSGSMELDVRKAYLADEAQLFTALYEGLFSYHPYTMSPVPAVAASWEVSEDKKQWTFRLRDDAKYWNGDPVTAEDFRTAWLSQLSPARESPYSSLFDIIVGARNYRLGRQRDAGRVGIEAPDSLTLVVRLTAPASFFPSMLCHHSFSPIHPSMVNKKNWSKEPPISNGPFMIQEQDSSRIVMVKNRQYWDAGNVALNRLTALFTQDADEASLLWNSGEVRWIIGSANLDTLIDSSGISLNAMFATHYYFIRSAAAPWSDYRVRQALSLALPWEEIRSIYALPADTLVYPIPGYPEINGLDTTDPEESARLLREAGFPQGAGMPELVVKITPSQDAARIVELMTHAWSALGVKSRVQVVPYEQYFDAVKQNDYTIAFSTWIGDFPDPYTFLQMWRRGSNLNDAQYNDVDYEKLMEKAMNEEGEQRMQTLAEAEELLLNRGAVLPIYYYPALNIIDTNELNGWYPNALDIHPFKYLAFKSIRPLPGMVMAPR